MLYNQPYGGAPNDPYVNGDPSVGRAGSIPPAASIEYPQREIVNFETDSGLTPTNSDLHQLSKAVQSGQVTFGVDSGAVNALSVSLTPAITLLRQGMVFCVKIFVTNTGATTLNVGTGAVPIVHSTDLLALGAGDLNAGSMQYFMYDSTGPRFQMMRTNAASIVSDLIDTAVTFTVHGGGATFTDLNAAFEYLTKFKITHNGSVLLQLAAGQFSYGSARLVLAHPNADRITIQGATLLSTAPSYANASTIFAVTGSGNQSFDRASILTRLRAIYATELTFSGGTGAGMTIITSSGITLANLLLSGDRSWPKSTFQPDQGVGLAVLNAIVYVQNVSVCNFCQSGVMAYAGTIIVANGSLSASGTGGVSSAGSGVAAAECGCIQYGINLTGAGYALIAVANDTNGVLANITSTVHAGSVGNLYALQNLGSDLTCGGSSYMETGTATFSTATPAVNVVGNNNSLITFP